MRFWKKKSPSFNKAQQQWLDSLHTVPSGLDVVVHIGMPKAGSSAFQKYCSSHRSYLQAHGYFYPEHFHDQNDISAGHSRLRTALLERKIDPVVLFNEFLQDAKKRNCTLLLSSETFWLVPELLTELLNGTRYVVFALIRHPADVIVSGYNQWVKRRFHTADLGEIVEYNSKKNRKNTSDLQLRAWLEAAGEDRFIGNPYHKSRLMDVGLPAAFLQILGVPIPESEICPQKELVNSSYLPNCLELKRMLNFVLDRDNTAMNQRLDELLQRASDRISSQQYGEQNAHHIEINADLHEKLQMAVAAELESLSTLLDISLESELRVQSKKESEKLSLEKAVSYIDETPVRQYLRTQIDLHLAQNKENNPTDNIGQVLQILDKLFLV